MFDNISKWLVQAVTVLCLIDVMVKNPGDRAEFGLFALPLIYLAFSERSKPAYC